MIYSGFLFLTSHFLFLTSHFLFLTSHFLFLSSHFLFLISHFLFLISHFLFLTSSLIPKSSEHLAHSITKLLEKNLHKRRNCPKPYKSDARHSSPRFSESIMRSYSSLTLDNGIESYCSKSPTVSYVHF